MEDDVCWNCQNGGELIRKRIETMSEWFKMASNSSDHACYSASLFMMGKVKTNQSFIFASPSSTFKTPLTRILNELYQKEFEEQRIHLKSKFTTEG